MDDDEEKRQGRSHRHDPRKEGYGDLNSLLSYHFRKFWSKDTVRSTTKPRDRREGKKESSISVTNNRIVRIRISYFLSYDFDELNVLISEREILIGKKKKKKIVD